MPVPWNQTDPASYITHCAASAFYFSRIGQFGSPTIFHIPDKSKKNVMTKRNKSALFLLGTWEWGGRGIYFFTFFLVRCALMRTMRSMRALWIVFEIMWPSDTCDEAGLLFVCKDSGCTDSVNGSHCEPLCWHQWLYWHVDVESDMLDPGLLCGIISILYLCRGPAHLSLLRSCHVESQIKEWFVFTPFCPLSFN